MLTNGWSGSGGDAFPFYFREAGLGPLIGERTWGGLIGITGAPQLIDGGTVTVPTFRMYTPDGKWFAEGLGVAPDFNMVENPAELASGNDQQREKGNRGRDAAAEGSPSGCSRAAALPEKIRPCSRLIGIIKERLGLSCHSLSF